jgi:asparagine synthase (glutamine-hydrolysing)
MCGIFAALTRRGLAPERRSAALRSLHHRGPDGSGSWTSRDGRWTLGHTRLSIIGLNNGEQPMTSPDGAVHLVVNGEFYGYREIRERLRASGYRFATESDSEIALHLYDERGMQAASELRGEFAVIIADERQQSMIAIRDRFGIKPLYYAIVNGEVFFASEIKALLAMGVPAAWDLEGAVGGLGRSHEKTEFAGISTVPPGCYAIARYGDVRIYPYWDWEIPTAAEMKRDTRSEAEVVADFRKSLLDSVRQRLVADVEVASYLSGGIDSCAVLGLAQQSTDRPIRAFTLTFENPLYDEASVAQAQARHVGASYHPIPITGREIADAYADAVWHSETQMFNGHGVAKYLLSRAVRDAGIKVVFTGEGADEMLGGYPYFRVDALNDNPSLSAAERSALLDQMLGANPATRAFLMPTQVNSPEMKAIERRLGWLPATLNVSAAMMGGVAQLFRDDLHARVNGYMPLVSALDRLPLAQRVDGRDRLNQMLYVNAKTVLPNFILNYLADRMEMAHSIEGRVPFLDHRVAEAAARVPVNMKVKGIREKHVLREAAKDVLIPEVYDRQKHPFTTPPTRSGNDPMLAFYRDTFASQAAKEQPIYDMAKVRAALDRLLDCPADQRIAMEGGLQRAATVTIMHEKFAMAGGGAQ